MEALPSVQAEHLHLEKMRERNGERDTEMSY